MLITLNGLDVTKNVAFIYREGGGEREGRSYFWKKKEKERKEKKRKEKKKKRKRKEKKKKKKNIPGLPEATLAAP